VNDAELRAIAEKATPGPWSGIYAERNETITIAHHRSETEATEADADHIAAWHPARAIAALDVIEAAIDVVENMDDIHNGMASFWWVPIESAVASWQALDAAALRGEKGAEK